MKLFSIIFICFCLTSSISQLHGEDISKESYDIVIYGGSSAGVIAAIQGSIMGKSVALIAPSGHLGGMTSNGLGAVDTKYPKAIGGLTRQYFNNLWNYYYQDTSAWQWGVPLQFKGQMVQYNPEDHLMWVLEPHVAEKIFEEMIAKENVSIIRGERLNRETGVLKIGPRILQITMESGQIFVGKMFIDATYEGDLMAAAKVSYIIGREANSCYNETLNGIAPYPIKKRIAAHIDPYIIEGDSTSGLLPRVYPITNEIVGEKSDQIQSYNFRICLTQVPENKVVIEKPDHYDELQYEILFRALKASYSVTKYIKMSPLPNQKVDANNNGSISTDYIGMSWCYPEADYATRQKISGEHERWQRGLLWTLQNHSRVTAKVKAYYSQWGLSKDEFQENNHWPYEIYVREARRMVSSFVINENTILGREVIEDSIGLFSYDMDSHAVKYVVSSCGGLTTEGGVYKNVPQPNSISYRAIIPIEEECQNLVVPVCLSASHIAYGAVRMEPTFMILGQSAATAASLAIDAGVALQEVPYELLREQLIKDGQVLRW